MGVRILLVLSLASAAAWAAAATAPKSCAGSLAIGSFRILVKPATGAAPLPLRQVNRLAAGDKISYQPINLPADLKNNAKLALVVAPQDPESDLSVTVLEPKTAASAAEWTLPFKAGLVGVVFGPQGLDEKRLTSLVSKDEEVITQLARYAEQTAAIESTIAALYELEDESDEEQARVAQLNPSERALYTLLRSVNPSASSYDPFGAGRLAGPVTRAGQAADGFFSNAGAIVPGGGALSGLKGFLMPDTEFRSVFVEPEGTDGVTFCAQRARARNRNRQTYFWAHRLLGTGAPPVELTQGLDLQAGRKAVVGVRIPDGSVGPDALDKVYGWTLEPKSGGQATPVPVRPVPYSRAVQVDLGGFKGAPGLYKLAGKWDWQALPVQGELRVHPPSNLKQAKAANDLTAGQGMQTLRLEGADFFFVGRAEFARSGRWRGGQDADFAVTGAESSVLEMLVDTDRITPGPAVARLTTSNGIVEEIPVQVQPEPPRLAGLPLRANLGEASQSFTLTGSGLDRIERITIENGKADWNNGRLVMTLPASAKAGDRLMAAVTLKGSTKPVMLPLAQVAGRRPRITEARPSLPEDPPVALKPGELPAGAPASFSLKVEGAADNAAVLVGCSEEARTLAPQKLRAGERLAQSRLERIAEGVYVLTVDPGVGQPGCALSAWVETESAGKSDPAALGKVVRAPRIMAMEWTDEKTAEGFAAVLTGEDLESIEKAGWDARTGVPVTALPVTRPGGKQSLKVTLPWPSPTPRAPLYVWLRGDGEGRATRVKP